jgi:hypothetical protein
LFCARGAEPRERRGATRQNLFEVGEKNKAGSRKQENKGIVRGEDNFEGRAHRLSLLLNLKRAISFTKAKFKVHCVILGRDRTAYE